MKLKRFATAGAGWLALMGTAAHAQAVTEATKPCLTPVEIQASLQMALPGVLRAVSEACKPKLSGTSFFATGGDAMIAGYDAAGEAASPVALAAIERLSAESDELNLPESIDPSMLSVMLGAILGPVLAEKLDPEACNYIDRAIGQLAPLPPENLAGLFAVGLEGVMVAEQRKAEKAAAEAAEAAANGEATEDEESDDSGIPFTVCTADTAAK
ncbi:hypothetical protein [Sphingosinithalassobacter portus]|uniref:hypothetical protein n=1 Tax=Stakelama portus TaxID=2676234 RepID=UPI000D6EA0C2|nr:hypothetical protein [Sphingosinithalassobacter portus]